MNLNEILDAMEQEVVLQMARSGMTKEERVQAKWNRDYQQMALKALRGGESEVPVALGAAIKGIAIMLAVAGKPEAEETVAKLVMLETLVMRAIVK